jgi:RES domain-containing protein
MLYCAATTSLCALEVLVHSAGLPKGKLLVVAEISNDIPIEVLTDSDLPSDWNALAAPKSTKDLGTRWAMSQKTAVLSVPSTIIPRERNFLINPLHVDFSKIKFKPPEPFVFDPRLK